MCPGRLSEAAAGPLCVSLATEAGKTEPVRWKMSVTAAGRGAGGAGWGGEAGGGAGGCTPLPTPGWCPGPGQPVGRAAGFLNEGAAPWAGGLSEGRRPPRWTGRMCWRLRPCPAHHHIVSEVIWWVDTARRLRSPLAAYGAPCGPRRRREEMKARPSADWNPLSAAAVPTPGPALYQLIQASAEGGFPFKTAGERSPQR